MSISLESDIIEEPLDIEPDVCEDEPEWIEFKFGIFADNVSKVKLILPHQVVQDNLAINLRNQILCAKLLICLIKKSNHGSVVVDDDYYTIIFSSKLFGASCFRKFRCMCTSITKCNIFIQKTACLNEHKKEFHMSYYDSSNDSGIVLYVGNYNIGCFIIVDDDLFESPECSINGEKVMAKKIDTNIYYLPINYTFNEFLNIYNAKKQRIKGKIETSIPFKFKQVFFATFCL